MVKVRNTTLAAELAANVDREGAGSQKERGVNDALIRTVLAQAASMSADAARWRAVANKAYNSRLMQTLIVAGHALSQAQGHEDAILLLSLALLVDAQHPAYQDGLEFLGVALQYAGHVGCAEMAHGRALALAGDRALPHLNLGLLKLHSGREMAARQHLQAAIALACGHESEAVQPLCAPALQGLGSAEGACQQPGLPNWCHHTAFAAPR